MEAIQIYRSLNRVQRNTFIACFLGWTLDALDFFLLTFVVKEVAAEFSVSIVKVAFAITLTLMMRPLGAIIFGVLGLINRNTPSYNLKKQRRQIRLVGFQGATMLNAVEDKKAT